MTVLFVILTLIGFSVATVMYYKYVNLQSQFSKFQRVSTDKEFALNSSLAFYYKNPMLEIEICSPALQRLLGISHEIDIDGIKDIFREDNPSVLGPALNQVYEGKNVISVQLKSPKDGGRIICYARRHVDENNRIQGILLNFEIDASGDDHLRIRLKKARDSVQSLLTILNHLPYPIWQRNKALEITYVNKAYMRMLRDKLSEITKVGGLELYNSGEELAEKAINDNTHATERRHLIVNGERKLFKISEIIDHKKGFIGFARDISEQEDIEEELEQNIETQSNFLESSTNATVILGPDKKLRFFNSAYAKLWGIDEEWLDTHPGYIEILDVLRKKRKLPEQVDFKAFKDTQLKIFNDLIEPQEEFSYLPDGIVLRVITVPHESGGLILSYEDITDRLALEESYNTLIAVKKATIDNLHEGISVFKEDGTIQLFNPVYAETWNLDDDFLDKSPHISDIIEETKNLYHYEGDWSDFKASLVKLFLSRTMEKKRVHRTDGAVLDWIRVPLPDGNILTTYQDVTDSFLVEKSLRSEKEALKEADTLKSNFLTNVSYEFRSPLTSIRGFSEALMQSYFGELNDKQKEYVNGIYNSSLSLTSLINDIIDMASIDAGYMKLEPEKFSLSKLINENSFALLELAKNSNRMLEIECEKEIGYIEADKKRIMQIINNLVNNSIRQTKEDTKILLSLSGNKKRIIISVEDSHRMNEGDKKDVVLEKFYGENNGQYNSLELPIVKSFVELHGGEIHVESLGKTGSAIRCTFNRKLKN